MKSLAELLPHRAPFLLVDRLEVAERERIVAYRTFTDADYFFKGHFPGYPVVPGVLLIEAMAQAGAAGVRELGIVTAKKFFLGSVEKAKFRRPVRPNEEVRMEIENLRLSPKVIKQRGTAYVGDEVAAEAEWLGVAQEE
jgi:3-hydroxyacyl-[acyl-carrier-protein] dehydratase